MSTVKGTSTNTLSATGLNYDSVIAATPPTVTDTGVVCKIPDAGFAIVHGNDKGSNAFTSAEGATGSSKINANGASGATADADSNKPRPSETPRTNRTDGKTEKLTTVCTQIAPGMNEEFVEYSVDVFLKHYLPFEPSEKAIEECISRLLCKDPAPLDDAIEGCTNPGQASKLCRQSARIKTQSQADYIDGHVVLSEVELKELQEPRIGDPETIVHRFTDYMERPGKQNSVEKTVFAPLKSIADAVGGYSESCDGRVRNKFQYHNCPDTVLSSDIGGSNNKIDACFSNGGSDLHTKFIAVPIEQKISVANRDSNNRQVVSANVQIMNDDVRRTFTYGITFEEHEATLWYHCRSHSAVSKPFSFVENPKLLIKVFLSFLFATDEELGYDPNVTPVEGEKRQYTFKIPSSDGKSAKFYRTVKVVSEYRSNNISGRMPRVWLVDRVDCAGNKTGFQCVLKDVWLPIDARTEKEIQTAIFADIEKFCHPDKPDYNLALNPPEGSPQASFNNIKMRNAELVKSGDYKQYFLEIESDHVGKPSKEVLKGCPPVMGLFQTAHENRIASLNNNGVRTIGSTGFTKTRQHYKRIFTPRKQYRVIVKEVCQAVGDLPTLGKVVKVIKQTVIPLSLRYCANWVHRDISSGNILAHQEGSVLRAKLSDLEYAKKFPLPEDEGNVDPKTGTPFFMPVEIMQNYYIYNEIDNDNDIKFAILDPTVLVAKKQLAELGVVRKNITQNTMSYNAVIYNFQHDLESLWWVLVWSLTARVNHQPSKTWANRVFQYDDVPTPERVKFLRASKKREADPFGKTLEDIMLPSISFLHVIVELSRSAMNIAYSERERRDTLRDMLSYAIIVDRFHFGFELLQSVLGSSWEDIPLVTKISANGLDSVQSAAANAPSEPTAVSGDPSLIPGRKRPNPNNQKSARSESFPAGTGDEDVEATLERQRSKRLKTQDDPNSDGGSNTGSNPTLGNSMTERRS